MKLSARLCSALVPLRMSEIFKHCDVFAKHPDLNSFLALQRDSEDFDRLKRWLATPPQYTTLRVNTLISSVVEAKTRLQVYVDSLRSRRENQDEYKVIEHPILDDTLIVVSPKSPIELTPYPRQVVIGIECAEAVLRGANVFVPGIMGAPSGLQKDDLVAVYADVNAKCLRGEKRRFQGEKVFCGNGRMKLSRDDIFKGKVLHGVAVDITEPIYNCPPLNNVLRDVLYLQNIPSIVCSRVLDPRPGQAVLDMCSAPGGKTCHIAVLMRNQGLVVALDKAKVRLEKTAENCSAWNLSAVQCFVHDATLPFDSNPDLKELPRKFDRIMVDAPCSALGQRPRLNYRQTLKEVNSYPSVQRALLRNACDLLKDDGFIVYSTCSINVAENEDVVAWALNNLPLQLVQQNPHLGGFGRPAEGLSEDEQKLCQRFEGVHPGEDFDRDTIGFFMAKFRRK